MLFLLCRDCLLALFCCRWRTLSEFRLRAPVTYWSSVLSYLTQDIAWSRVADVKFPRALKFLRYYKFASLFPIIFSPHTYLVVDGAITKAFVYVLSPALHTAAAKGIELSSGTSTAQFLMVFISFFSSMSHALMLSFEEEIFSFSGWMYGSAHSAGIFVVA